MNSGHGIFNAFREVIGMSWHSALGSSEGNKDGAFSLGAWLFLTIVGRTRSLVGQTSQIII